MRKIRTFRSPSRLWYFHIQADNNEIIAPSEGYKTERAMLDTLEEYFPDWEVVPEEQPKSEAEPSEEEVEDPSEEEVEEGITGL